MSYTINLANNILAFQGTLTRPLRHQEKLVKQLCELAIAKESRIAELEAEVALLKKAPEKTLGELFAEKVLSQPVSPEIEEVRRDLRKERFHNNVLRFEEGE